MSTAEQNSPQLPTDLIFNIISRLPAKSVARCRCLSKLWASLLTSASPYFTELFLTHSKTRPRLLFTVLRNNNELGIYSCPQPQILYNNQNPSLSVTAEFYMILPRNMSLDISGTFSGLIFCLDFTHYKPLRTYSGDIPMLCNPITKHFLRLPHYPTKTQLTIKRAIYQKTTTILIGSFFGYDPIDKQCSILLITGDHLRFNYHTLKLGSERVLAWKNIECPLDHHPLGSYTCINGVLYYRAFLLNDHNTIVRFDLNSEEFKFIDLPFGCDMCGILVNFKGKLGVIGTKCVEFGEDRSNVELTLWVLEDVVKQEWSKHVYCFPLNLWNREFSDIFVIGVTARGEVVLSLRYITPPFYVYFFDLEKNILQKVEIKGFEGFKSFHYLEGSVDYVEDLKDLN